LQKAPTTPRDHAEALLEPLDRLDAFPNAVELGSLRAPGSRDHSTSEARYRNVLGVFGGCRN
jgi:hypothetical protein